MQRERLSKVFNREYILFVFEGIFYLEIKPLLMTLGVGVHIKV